MCHFYSYRRQYSKIHFLGLPADCALVMKRHSHFNRAKMLICIRKAHLRQAIIILLTCHLVSQAASQKQNLTVYYERISQGLLVSPDININLSTSVQCAALCFKASKMCQGFSITWQPFPDKRKECRVAFSSPVYADATNSSLYLGKILILYLFL